MRTSKASASVTLLKRSATFCSQAAYKPVFDHREQRNGSTMQALSVHLIGAIAIATGPMAAPPWLVCPGPPAPDAQSALESLLATVPRVINLGD